MKKLMIFIHTICLVLLLKVTVMAQTISVFIDDTAFVKKTNKQVSGFNIYNFELKDSLPDGYYVLYHKNSYDSLNQDSSKVIMTGNYANGVRDGLFYYFYGPYKVVPNPEMRLKYAQGLLEGFQYRSTFRQEIQTSYSSGKLNGLSLVHNELVIEKQRIFGKKYIYRNYISFIINYVNDSVIQWMQMQPDVLFVYRIGYGSIRYDRCIVEEYDSHGFIKYIYFFKNGTLIQVDNYSRDGFITTRYYYDTDIENDLQNQSCYIHISNDIEFKIINYTPINGSIEKLDKGGTIINRRTFINNRVQ